MKTKEQIERRLTELEQEMVKQFEEIRESGFGSAAGLFWDKRCIERATLHWALGMNHEPFCAGDTMAGW